MNPESAWERSIEQHRARQRREELAAWHQDHNVPQPGGPEEPVEQAPQVQTAPYPFTAAELRRLEIYRAAVRAGFYNEG